MSAFSFELPEPVTEFVDHYGLWITVPPTQLDPAHEVSAVRVTLQVADADHAEDGVRPGDVFCRVALHGHRLTWAGRRPRNAGGGRFITRSTDEARHELTRQAVLASLARHGLEAERVRDLDLRPWSEARAAEEAQLLARFGITADAGGSQ